jgi:ribose transport system ATP-binding protein
MDRDRALVGNPCVVVFDEATAALDHPSVERFFDVVRHLRESGACVLIVTHRIHELATICDRATVLNDGTDVSTLAGAEITEARLLELMRGGAQPEPPLAPRLRRVSSEAHTRGQEVLAVSGVKLTAQAAPVQLAVRAGEIVGLAGLEGHGQVEFIQTVSGFRQPAAVQVYINRGGRKFLIDSAKSADRAGLVYIPGDRKREGLFANLSVFENFGISCYRATSKAGFIRRREVKKMFLEQVEALSIRLGRSNAPINSLSGGNQQKVIIARALAAAPRAIALNDPTRGIDIGAKRDLYALLRSLAQAGKAILFLSNEIEEFAGLCDRVLVFRLQTLFCTLTAEQTTSSAVLAAMFGYDESRSSNFVNLSNSFGSGDNRAFALILSLFSDGAVINSFPFCVRIFKTSEGSPRRKRRSSPTSKSAACRAGSSGRSPKDRSPITLFRSHHLLTLQKIVEILPGFGSRSNMN